jgi:hypothetical protein
MVCNNKKMMNRVISELAYLFRADRRNRPLLLLGSGSSYRSGIPLAGDAVKLIAKASYARSVMGVDWRRVTVMPSDWMPYLQRQEWFISDVKRFSENFPLAVQNLLTPVEFRRDVLMEMIQPPNGINDGYHHLAKLMMKGLCCTILTPNFDSLAASALRELHPHIRTVIEINRTHSDLVALASTTDIKLYICMALSSTTQTKISLRKLKDWMTTSFN